MVVAQEEMYSRLKDYTWVFGGAEYDLYSSVDINDEGELFFELNRMMFTLSNFIIRGPVAKITATCDDDTATTAFTFTGTEV